MGSTTWGIPQAVRDRRSRLALRAVFAAVLVLLPAEMLVSKLVGEPYPGVFMPGFSTTPVVDSTLTQLEPRVTVIYDDGSTNEIAPADLLPPTAQLSTLVFEAAYFDDEVANDASTSRWLSEAIPPSTDGSHAQSIVIDWYVVDYRVPELAETSASLIKSISIEVD